MERVLRKAGVDPTEKVDTTPPEKHTPIEDLGLSVRTHGVLERHNIYYAEELANLSEEEVWDMKGIGPKGLAEIREKIKPFYPEGPSSAYPEPESPINKFVSNEIDEYGDLRAEETTSPNGVTQ